jgi:hypothetical protein
MYTLNAVDSFQISGPKDTYIYDIVSVAGGLAAISSDDSLRLFDPLALSGTPLNSVRQVNTDVTCLKAINSSIEADALIVCTAGRDGRVCLLDPRSGARIGEVRTGGFLLGLSLSCAFAAVHFDSDFLASLCLVHFLSSWFCFPEISHVICEVEYKYLCYHGRGYGIERMKSSDLLVEQNAPVLSLACSHPYAIAAGTELTNHQASVLIWSATFS